MTYSVKKTTVKADDQRKFKESLNWKQALSNQNHYQLKISVRGSSHHGSGVTNPTIINEGRRFNTWPMVKVTHAARIWWAGAVA